MNVAEITLGMRVVASDTLFRVTGERVRGVTGAYRPERGVRKTWKRRREAGSSRPGHVEGVVVGVRTLHETGVAVYLGEDQGTGWERGNTRTAVLIAYDLHRKPALAWPEDVRPVLAASRSVADELRAAYERDGLL